MSPVPDWRWATQWLPAGDVAIEVSVTFRGHTGRKHVLIGARLAGECGEDEVAYQGGKAAKACLRQALIDEYGLNDAELGRDHFAPPGWKPEAEK